MVSIKINYRVLGIFLIRQTNGYYSHFRLGIFKIGSRYSPYHTFVAY